MSIIDALDLQTYRQPYVIANTPLFLYKRIRAIAETQHLATLHTPEALVAAFNEHANRVDGPSDEDELRAYIALIALSFGNPVEVARAIQRIRPQRLRWAKPILDVIREPQISTTIETISVRPPQARIVEGPSTSPVTSSIILVNR